jgi:U3 small nucleolar RNA-associated protein 18
VDGKTNPKIQTVNFENFPVKCARFSADGRQFLVGSQHHPHLYVYDMMAGKIAKVRWNRTKAADATNSQLFEVSPDGQLVAVRGRAGAIHLLSAK